MNGVYAFFSRKDVEAQNTLIQRLKKDIEETGRKKKVSSDFFWKYREVNNCSLDYGSWIEYLKDSNIPQSKPK